MNLAACQAISLPDGTFLTSAVVCWDVSHAGMPRLMPAVVR